MGALISGLERKKPALWQSTSSWAESHPPRYPWRRSGSPYRVLIGEMLLEKLRSGAIPASERFLAAFPSVDNLLAAKGETITGVLESLHLQRHRDSVTRLINGLITEGKGGLPCDSETLARISGLERHHVMAVFCFGYGLPIAIVDGHVRRMLKRLFAGSLPIHPSIGLVEAVAENLVSDYDPQTYNRVLLDLAELVCRAEGPHCPICPLLPICDAAPGARMPEGSSNRALVGTS